MHEADVGKVLSWLADSPLFVDAQQIDAFYDAVVGSAFRTVQMRLSTDDSQQTEKSLGARLGAKLLPLFPWLSVDADAEAQRATVHTRHGGRTIVVEPVHSPARQLVELSLHYMVNQQDRLRYLGPGMELPDHAAIAKSPRMIAFLDTAPGTIFLPQAAELNNGRVITFFDVLVEQLKHEGGTLPVRYPDDTATDEGRRMHDEYWNWFTEHWHADGAVKVIEDCIGDGGRPRWIDYRVVLSTGAILHMHVDGRGIYDTGVFAYNLVRRGWRHGVRIIGSLKSEPALNVLAIYEK